MKSIIFFVSILVFSSCSQSQDIKWESLFLFDGRPSYYGSSEIEDLSLEEWGDIGAYSANWLSDKNVSTAWVEGVSGNGIGEYVLIELENTFPEKIHINNGYQKTESLYFKNNRPKTLKLSLYIAYHLPGDVTELGRSFQCLHFPDSTIIHLKDEIGTQVFEMPFDIKKVESLKKTGDTDFVKQFEERIDEFIEHEHYYGYILKVEILDIYKGSHYDDTGISDIWFSNEKKVEVRDYKMSAREKIIRVFQKNGNIYFSTTKQDNIYLVSINDVDDERIAVSKDQIWKMKISDVSPDKEWVQIDFYFIQGHSYRRQSLLYNVRLQKKVDKALLNDSPSTYRFEEQNGKTHIVTDDGFIDLENVWELIRE